MTLTIPSNYVTNDVKKLIAHYIKKSDQSLEIFLLKENKIIDKARADLTAHQMFTHQGIPFIYELYPDDYIEVSQKVKHEGSMIEESNVQGGVVGS